MFPSLDSLDRLLGDRKGLRLRIACPSQEFSELEMRYGVGRWYSGVRGLWEILAISARPELALVMMQAPTVPTEVVDYLLTLRRPGECDRADARRRLAMVELDDVTHRHLSEKFLASEEALARLRGSVDLARSRGHRVEGLACFASSARMLRLADRLGLRMLETPPSTLGWGTKSGSRELFRRIGVPHQPGTYKPAHSQDRLVDELFALTAYHGPNTWLVKVDHGFGSGHGNAMITVSAPSRAKIRAAVSENLRPVNPATSRDEFLANAYSLGAVIELMVVAPPGARLRFPSVSLHLCAESAGISAPRVLGTHDQLIDRDQSFIGATQPADSAYRDTITAYANLAGGELGRLGVRGHVGVDFVAISDDSDPRSWRVSALEVNLRQTGTTHADRTAVLLTDAECQNGRLVTPAGRPVCYTTTDSLIKDEYRRLTPAGLITALRSVPALEFDPVSARGVVPHLWTTLTRFGKVGATILAQSVEECLHMQGRFTALLDRLASPAPAEPPG